MNSNVRFTLAIVTLLIMLVTSEAIQFGWLLGVIIVLVSLSIGLGLFFVIQSWINNGDKDA
jgi:cytochrome bd-type quinol oxidase subunit 1